jgi:hypothetical protein
MKMTLPAYMPTLKSHSTGNHTRVDNIFCSEGLVDTIIKCTTDEATRPARMDHYSIIMQLNIRAPKVTTKSRLNFRLADWPKLTTTLKNNLDNLPNPMEITNTQQFDRMLKELNEAIQDAVNKHVPNSKPCPYSKRWWMTKLVSEKKKMQQLGGQAKYHRMNKNHLIHEEYCQQCNRYSEKI